MLASIVIDKPCAPTLAPAFALGTVCLFPSASRTVFIQRSSTPLRRLRF
jgi:hypothetical protein